MGIKYTRLSEREELNWTSLQVCNGEEADFSVLQYKVEGNLLYSHNRGIYSENEEKQKRRIEAFLVFARQENIDLAIAPEASVPWEVAEKVVKGVIKPPREGKLWYLGMEGVSLDDFDQTVEEWKKEDDIAVICSGIGNAKKHVNSAIYFFKSAKGKLAVVIQIKTGGMKDISYENEQNDLSLGNEIFLLDLNGADVSHNIVAGMICADIFHLNTADFCRNFHGKAPLILHIQMNPKPYYKEMASFRDMFFRDSEIRYSQIITANWGRGTSIRLEDLPDAKKKGYTDSGSTVYMNLQLNHGSCEFYEILKQESFIRHMGQVQQLGFEYFLTEKYEIWKIQEAIEVINYRMRKGFYTTVPKITDRKLMPYIIHNYRFDENDSLIKDLGINCDCSEMQDIFHIFDKDCGDIGSCADKSCGECRRFYVDFLISLCLGEEVYDEYRALGEQSNRAIQTLYQDCKDTYKKNLLKELVEELKKGRFPERFGDFNKSGSFVFAVNDNCARNGGDYRYNLNLKNGGQGIKRLLVVYIGHAGLADAKKKFTDLQQAVHEDMQDKVLLYYADSDGIKVYDEPYIEESILKGNSDYCKNIESFT